MKLPGLAPGEFHLPEKRLKATAYGADKNAVGTDKKNSLRRGQTRWEQTNEGCADKPLAVRINTCGTFYPAQNAPFSPCSTRRLAGFFIRHKIPLSRAFPPRSRSFPPIKNPAVSGVFIAFKTGHTKKCLTVFPFHNYFAKRVVRVVRAVFPLKIFIVHHFAHFLLGGIIRLYVLG